MPLAALVNGEPILLEDYEGRVSLEVQAVRALGIDLGSEEGKTQLAQIRQELLQKLIDQLLIRQEGELRGVLPSPADLEARIQADVEAGGGQMAFSGWLAASGQTLQDYEQMVNDALISQRVMEEVTADLSATAGQVHIRQIVVGTEEEAAEVLALLREGHGFGKVAREHSLDLATRDSGGDMGWFPLTLLSQEQQQAVATLQPGEISGALRTGDRYQVLQVLERELDRPLAPDVYAELKLTAFQEWLEAQRAMATIQRFVGE